MGWEEVILYNGVREGLSDKGSLEQRSQGKKEVNALGKEVQAWGPEVQRL